MTIAPLRPVPTPLATAASTDHAVKIYGSGLTEVRALDDVTVSFEKGRFTRWESVVIALQGTLIGVGVGVFFGWALVRGLEDQGLVAFTVPVTRLAVIVVLAALSGVVAAVLPARRAARLNVLKAVVTE